MRCTAVLLHPRGHDVRIFQKAGMILTLCRTSSVLPHVLSCRFHSATQISAEYCLEFAALSQRGRGGGGAGLGWDTASIGCRGPYLPDTMGVNALHCPVSRPAGLMAAPGTPPPQREGGGDTAVPVCVRACGGGGHKGGRK